MAATDPQPWWHRAALLARYQPEAQAGEPGDLLVGVGAQRDPATDAFVALNHKTAPPVAGAPSFASLCMFVARTPRPAEWRRVFPNGIADVRRIVVEDASLDTCLSLLLFARAISPDAPAHAAELGAVQTHASAAGTARIDAWLAYVQAWEQGRYLDGADPRHSPACQMAALAHCMLAGTDGKPGRPTDTNTLHALRACLALLDGYIASNEQPVDAQPPRHLAQYALADSQLEFEYQQYRLALKYGVQTQLRMPLASSQRTVLVDALIMTDVELTGVLKVLARTDVERSWTKRGFALLGVWRPALAGSGNDMTISVDPGVGVTLKDLWLALEQLEDERWGPARPRNQPRKGIVAYTDAATGEPASGAPNQPWYDERGRYTLLGAPKFVAPGVPGTRVDWQADVLALLWRLYPPFGVELKPESLQRAGGRHVARVHWPAGDASAAGRTPALRQHLASCSAEQPARHPGELVPMRSIDVIELAGGEIIVHPQGVTLFDDWTAATLFDGWQRAAGTAPALQQAAVELARITADYTALQGSVTQLMEHQRVAMEKPGRVGFRRIAELRDRILELKRALAALAAREAALPAVRGVAELRVAVEKIWGLPDARDSLWETVTRLEDLLKQAQDLVQERRQFWSTAIISLAGVFFILRDLLTLIAGSQTMSNFDIALANAVKMELDPKAIEALRDSAALSAKFDSATLVLLVLVVLIGGGLAAFRYFGAAGMPKPDADATRRADADPGAAPERHRS